MHAVGCSYHSDGEGIVQLPGNEADQCRGQQQENEGIVELGTARGRGGEGGRERGRNIINTPTHQQTNGRRYGLGMSTHAHTRACRTWLCSHSTDPPVCAPG